MLLVRLVGMTLGRAPAQEALNRPERKFCDGRVSESSIYRLLAERCHELFADEKFADLFRNVGRCSVPPRIVAVVMVLQRIEGLSDREAVDRFTFDLRWKYASGVAHDYPEFVHTVLVDMRARLRDSERPNRIFDTTLEVARTAGLIGRKRVLDSTALYDAVATQDTVTMVRSAIRNVLRAADAAMVAQVRVVLKRDDDYLTPGKPKCEWDEKEAREALVDALARDAFAVLAYLDGRAIEGDLAEAAKVLSAVTGQDIEQRDDKVFRILRGVAADRIISTVDPEARHGHKTAARGFDGFKGHIAVDPDSEIITATEVTAGNVGDAAAAKDLLEEVLGSTSHDSSANDQPEEPAPAQELKERPDAQPDSDGLVEVFGDASYGSADLVEHIESKGAVANVKVQPPTSRDGQFAQDAFHIDADAGTVTCPAGQLVQLRRGNDGYGRAEFGPRCDDCPQRHLCTTSKTGRVVNVHPKHNTLARSRARQRDPEFKRVYKATRPKVERKISHMMRRRHGGRRSRMRGRLRTAQDFALLAAAVNLSRLAALKTPVTAAQIR